MMFAQRQKQLTACAALLLMAGAFAASPAVAGACTYREAIMALERGNAVRGMTLMRMASRDGDPRAAAYLREKDFTADTPVFARLPQPLRTASTRR